MQKGDKPVVYYIYESVYKLKMKKTSYFNVIVKRKVPL